MFPKASFHRFKDTHRVGGVHRKKIENYLGNLSEKSRDFQQNFFTRRSILHSKCSKTPFEKKCRQKFSDHKHSYEYGRKFFGRFVRNTFHESTETLQKDVAFKENT